MSGSKPSSGKSYSKKHPLVSIIVPNYNHQCFLESRLQSILNQSFQNYELILLDDQSSDDSLIVLKKYAHHPKVSQLIINEQNSKSPFKQWKKGISLAKGKYIWIAESDDFADPLFLEKTVTILEKKSSIGLVSVYSQMVDETDQLLQSTQDWLPALITKDPKEVYTEDGTSFLLREMLYKNAIYNASGVLFRTDLTKNIVLDYTSFRQAGDVAFWIELLRQSDVAIIKENLSYWRKHSNSVTQQNYKTGSMVMTEHLKIIGYLLQNLEPAELELHFPPNSTLYNNLIKRWYRLRNYSLFPWGRQDWQFLFEGQRLNRKFSYHFLRIVYTHLKSKVAA